MNLTALQATNIIPRSLVPITSGNGIYHCKKLWNLTTCTFFHKCSTSESTIDKKANQLSPQSQHRPLPEAPQEFHSQFNKEHATTQAP